MIGALVLVAFAPVLSGIRRGFPMPGLRLSEVLIVGVAISALALGDPQARVRWRALDWMAFAYAITTPLLLTVNLIRRGEPLDADAIGAMFGPLQFFLLYRVIVTYCHTARTRVRATKYLLVLTAPVALVGILQVLEFPGVLGLITALIGRAELFQGWDYSRQARATSIFPSWHAFGAYLMLTVLLGSALLMESVSAVMRRSYLLLVLLTSGVALAYTATLAPITGIVFGLLLLGWFTGRLPGILLSVSAGCFVVAMAAAPHLVQRLENQFQHTGANGDVAVPQAIQFRLDIWQHDHLPALAGYWATGYGPEFPEEVSWRFSENVYITLLFRGGLPLLAVFLAMLWMIGTEAHRQRGSSDPLNAAISKVVLTTVILLIPMQMIAPYLTLGGITHLFWVLVGLMVSSFDERDEVQAVRLVPQVFVGSEMAGTGQ